MRKAILVLFSLLISGCLSNNINKNFSPSEESGTGVLLGSVTYWGNHSKYAVRARKVGSDDSFVVSSGSSQRIPFVSATEMSDYGTHGDTFAVELEPGIYEFYSWYVLSRGFNTYSQYPFSVKVKVEPGKAVYIGNFHFQKSGAVLSSVTGAKVTLSDNFDRDMRFIKPNWPNLKEISKPKELKLADLGSSSVNPVDVVIDMMFLMSIQGAALK